MTNLEFRLRNILDEHVAKGVVGISLAISMPGQEMKLVTSGFANKFNFTPMTSDHIFRIASCTKTFIATGLHLLVEDGCINFEEPITKWFPTIPRAAELPVRILLNHRSGLPDFETAMPVISDKEWSAEEIVEFAFQHGEQKAPWREMEYSNTGYIMAGIIIAKETGSPYSEFLRHHIFEPSGMEDTWVGTYEEFPLGQQARGYMHVENDGNGQWDVSGAGNPKDGVWDSTEWFPLSGANAAGDILSTPSDCVKFLNALFDGKILGEKQLWEMKDNLDSATFPGSTVTHHGHGILGFTYGNLLVKGHLGQLPGHTSVMGRDENNGTTLMFIQNSGAGDFESFYLEGIHEPVSRIFAEAANFARRE